MKLLVIGAQGQLARSLAEAEKPLGLTVVALGRPELNLLEYRSTSRGIDRIGPDLVINAAAYTAVDKAESESEMAYAINAEAAGHVAEACARAATPLIHISTDYVFGDHEGGPFKENGHLVPPNIYGLSKLEGERRVAAACPQHLILRTAWLYSPFGQNFFKTMLRLAESQPEVAVVDDQIGNPTYVPHLAEGILMIALKILHTRGRATPWGIYHIAGAGEASWCVFAREIFRQSGKCGGPVAKVRPITTAEYPTAARRPSDSRLDCSKCGSTFGVRLPHWMIGVADCLSQLQLQKGPQGGCVRTP
jgi:dTDP-4-dehydrorhamnose reductase